MGSTQSTWGVVQSCSQDQDKDSLRMVGGKDRPVLKLKDMEEKHFHNLFLKNMSGLIEEVKNPTPQLKVWRYGHSCGSCHRVRNNPEEVSQPPDGGHPDLVPVQDQGVRQRQHH